MKKMYEKPVAEVLRMDDTMQMICSSANGFKNQTPIQIGKWSDPEETDAEGTSTEIKEEDLPAWLKENP